jgi:hypothetical protein
MRGRYSPALFYPRGVALTLRSLCTADFRLKAEATTYLGTLTFFDRVSNSSPAVRLFSERLDEQSAWKILTHALWLV